MLALTVLLTFVLPKVHRPRKTGLGDTGLPENAAVEGRVDDGTEPPAGGPAEGRADAPDEASSGEQHPREEHLPGP
jgi:UDP-GlcNAc:undecaprenyl-phosphate GlcNAc-1-phosphate transferase